MTRTQNATQTEPMTFMFAANESDNKEIISPPPPSPQEIPSSNKNTVESPTPSKAENAAPSKEDFLKAFLSQVAAEKAGPKKVSPLDRQDENGDTVMHIMCREGNTQQAVTLMLVLGADIGIQNNYGETPLHCAAKSHYATFATLLEMIIKISIGKQEEPESKDKSGASPTMKGARKQAP